jgi:hypothetical protein
VAKIIKDLSSDPFLFALPGFEYLSTELEKLKGISPGRFFNPTFSER